MSFNKLVLWPGMLSCCLLSIAMVSTTSAQDEDFESLKQTWAELEEKITETQAAIDGGDVAAEADFRDLVDQANTLIGQLRETGIESLNKNANNKNVVRTLMGIMVNDAAFKRDKEVIQLGHELIKNGINPRYFEVAAESDRLNIKAREIFEELSLRLEETNQDDLPQVKLTTTKGEILLELFENEAPNTVANFINLIEREFYDGIAFHRVVEGFMAQTGCPNGNGMGGPGYTIPCECYTPSARRHFTGSLSMAKSPARDSGGSQFFLTFSRRQNLDGQHTVFGRVVSGWDVLDRLTRTHEGSPEVKIPGVENDKIVSAKVIRKRDHKYKLRKTGEPDERDEKDQPPVEAPSTEPEMVDENSEESVADESAKDDAAKDNVDEDNNEGDDGVPQEPESSEGKSEESGGEPTESESSEAEPSSEPDSEESEESGGKETEDDNNEE